MRQKKIGIGVVFILIIIVFIIFKENDLSNGYFSKGKLRFLTKYTKEASLYEIDEAAGLEDVYTGYLEALGNSETYYLNKHKLRSAQVTKAGNSFGVGLKLMWSLDEHYLIVVDVLDHSPAQRAGVKIGDCITKINELQTVVANSSKLTELIYSAEKEIVTYEIRRDKDTIVVDLIPEEIIIEDLKQQVMDDVLYVKINSVKTGTSSRLESALKQMDENCKGLILDLRDLSTDLVEEVREISDLFLEEEIAFKIQTKADGVVPYKTTAGSYDIEVILITNSRTRCGAEALVSALENRAQILGGNTGGDAYIKKIVAFDDGTGMSVASGVISDRYGEQISDEGIEPDVRLYISEEEKVLMFEKGYIDYKQDTYLQEAIKRLQHDL